MKRLGSKGEIPARLYEPSEITGASVLEHYSHCGLHCDPETGDHNYADGEYCERCGAWIHVKVVVVNHPIYGDIHVGSECVKDLLGYNWGVSHEQAMAIQDSLDEQLPKHGTPFTILGKSTKSKMMLNLRLRESYGVNYPHRVIKLQFAINKRVMQAAMDLGLPWELEKQDKIKVEVRGFSETEGTAWQWILVAKVRDYFVVEYDAHPTRRELMMAMRDTHRKLLDTCPHPKIWGATFYSGEEQPRALLLDTGYGPQGWNRGTEETRFWAPL